MIIIKVITWHIGWRHGNDQHCDNHHKIFKITWHTGWRHDDYHEIDCHGDNHHKNDNHLEHWLAPPGQSQRQLIVESASGNL